MKKSQTYKIILIITLTIILISLSIVSSIGCKRRLPIWQYNSNTTNRPLIVDNWGNINQYTSYTRGELKLLLDEMFSNHIDMILEIVPFSRIRETYQGYYTIIQLNDKSRVFLFFDFELTLVNYFFVYHFNPIQEADALIPKSYFGKTDIPVPHYALPTGNNQQAFQFADGIVAVLYETVYDPDFYLSHPIDMEYIAKAKHTITYTALRWNPIARDELEGYLYIYSIDRNY